MSLRRLLCRYKFQKNSYGIDQRSKLVQARVRIRTKRRTPSGWNESELDCANEELSDRCFVGPTSLLQNYSIELYFNPREDRCFQP